MPAYSDVERVDGVGQPALLADLLEQPRRRRAAEDVVEHAQREAALVVARDARARRGRRGTARSSLATKRARGASRRAPAADAGGRGAAARRASARAATSSTSASWSTEPAAATTTLPRHVARRRGRPRSASAGAPATTSARPMIAPAERVVAEDGLAEHVEDLVLRVVLVHRDLLEDDLALVRRGRRRRTRGRQTMSAMTSNASLEVHVEHARVDRRGLLAGARVELGAHAVEDLVDLQRAVARRAAEQHVLEQVRQAGLGLVLGRRARADPEPERHGPHGGHVPP